VPIVGGLVATDDVWEPFRLVDGDGVVVAPVGEYLRDLQAAGRSSATARSYGVDLLCWFRFRGLSTLRGTGRVGWRPATSAGGCRWLAVRHGCIGVIAPVSGCGSRAGRRTRRRCGRTARRCCAVSMTFTVTWVPGRSSTRSRWTGPDAAAGRMLTAIRWTRHATSGPAFTGRQFPCGYRAACPTTSSTRSSRGFHRTAIGRWSRSMCARGRGRVSSCRLPRVASIRGGS
jgi:hypothetical protein